MVYAPDLFPSEFLMDEFVEGRCGFVFRALGKEMRTCTHDTGLSRWVSIQRLFR